MNTPRIVLIYGDDPAAQREVANDLCDLLSRSLVMSFATPLREAYRATFDVPRTLLDSASEGEEIANFVADYRDFLRGREGEDVLGILLGKLIGSEWWTWDTFIIEDGNTENLRDIRVITKKFTHDVLVVNMTDCLPLKSNSNATVNVVDQKPPHEIAEIIRNNL